MSLENMLTLESDRLIRDIRAKAADGLTFGEFVGSLNDAVSRLVKAAAVYAVAGPLKKEAVTAAALAFFGSVAPLVNLPWVPKFVASWILGFVRESIPHVIESAYQAVKPYLESAPQ